MEEITKMEEVNHKPWLLALERDRMLTEVKPEEKQKKMVASGRPKNKMQSLVLGFYETLDSAAGNIDCYDSAGYATKVFDHKQHYKVIQSLTEIGAKAGYKFKEDQYSPAGFKKFLFEFAEYVLGGSGGRSDLVMETIREAINAKYDDLVGEIDEIPVFDMEKAKERIEEEVSEIEANLKENREKYQPLLDRIQAVKGTPIEKLARQLDKYVVVGAEYWETILYSALSPYCPKFKVNGIPARNNLHTLLIGDISSGKDKIMSVIGVLSPKSTVYTGFTKASFEGIATMGEDTIADGIVDELKDGVLMIQEYSSIRIPYERQFLDNTPIKITKGGVTKEIEPNTSIMTAINPNSDFFKNDLLLRGQLELKDGVLSRFDNTIYLINTKEKNENILNKMELFGGNTVNLNEEKLNIATLATGIRQIKEVVFKPEHKEMLKEAYRFHNKESTYRPLLILRDLEILARFANTIACTNMASRKIDWDEKDKLGVLYAEDEDINKAIKLWENIIHTREQFLVTEKRNILSIKEKILFELLKNKASMEVADLFKTIVEDRAICKKAAFYQNLSDLILEQKIVKEGERSGVIKAV